MSVFFRGRSAVGYRHCPLAGEETFSRPEAGPGCTSMDRCPLNGRVMQCTTQNIMWCGPPNIGRGLSGKISGSGLSSCCVRLLNVLVLELKNWKWPRTMPIFSGFSTPLCDCQGRGDLEEYFGEPSVPRVSGIAGAAAGIGSFERMGISCGRWAMP